MFLLVRTTIKACENVISSGIYFEEKNIVRYRKLLWSYVCLNNFYKQVTPMGLDVLSLKQKIRDRNSEIPNQDSAALIRFSASSTSSSIGALPGSMGLSTSQVMGVKVFSGYMPYCIIFQESLMAIGTSRASGHFFSMVAIPPTWKLFTSPFLERVPSGNITADH